MSRPSILYYAQDPGGTRYLDPVVSELMRRDHFDWSIMLHPFAAGSAFATEDHTDIRASFTDTPPANDDFFVAALDSICPDAIICTTSAQARDSSNGTLIATARHKGIPTIGALDHWKGLDRFFQNNQPDYFPSHLICIDETSVKVLAEVGLDESLISAVGHPGLEQISRANRTPASQPWKILLISQPIARDGSYHGIFDEPYNGQRLVDEITSTLGADISDGAISVHLRSHPKEHVSDTLREQIEIDTCQDWNDALAYYDVFVGFDSMALMEASLSGAPCIRLALTDMPDISDQAIPFEFGVATYDLAALADDIRAAVSRSHASKLNPFDGSTVRACDIIETFVNSNL